jgi:hypothetical protein
MIDMILDIIKFTFLMSIAIFQIFFIHDAFLTYLSYIVIFGSVMLLSLGIMMPKI